MKWHGSVWRPQLQQRDRVVLGNKKLVSNVPHAPGSDAGTDGIRGICRVREQAKGSV